jgi:hypothetical protein
MPRKRNGILPPMRGLQRAARKGDLVEELLAQSFSGRGGPGIVTVFCQEIAAVRRSVRAGNLARTQPADHWIGSQLAYGRASCSGLLSLIAREARAFQVES